MFSEVHFLSPKCVPIHLVFIGKEGCMQGGDSEVEFSNWYVLKSSGYSANAENLAGA